MSTATLEVPVARRLSEPPPVRRDRVAQSWVAVATISWFGDAAFTIALAWTAVHLLAPALAGVVVGIETLPQAALMLVGGVIADRFNTRRVMLVGEIGRVIVLLAACAAWTSGVRSAGVLLAVAISFGIAAGLSNPARATLARQLVRPDDLITVSGWSQIGSRLAGLAGAPVGAILVAHGGLGAAMLVDAATFAAVAAVLAVVVRPRFALPRTTGAPWWTSLRDGLSYLARTPSARWLTLGLSSLNVFTTPVVAIGVALRVATSGWASTWVGAAEACFAAGAIAGSVVGIRWRRGHLAARAFRVLVVQGAAIPLIGLPSHETLLGGMAVLGITAGIASVWFSGVFQKTIAPSHLGRVSSVSQLGDLALTPLVLPLYGAIAAGAGVATGTALCGVAMALLCAYFASRPAIRSLPQ